MTCEICSTPSLGQASNYPPLRQQANLQEAKKFSYALTGLFEGGKTSSLQTKDSGIVSYGKFQATLASGTLERVLTEYINTSSNYISEKLLKFFPKVLDKDSSLRNDKDFLTLLKDAALDPKMEQAQDSIFTNDYWKPAANLAKKLGLQSNLAYAIFFDTKIQGGLEKVLHNSAQKIGDSSISEADFLNVFLDERTSYLKNIALAKKTSGDEQSAKMLESSITHRVGKLRSLIAMTER